MREGKPVDISSISKIPISMVVGEIDKVCKPEDARSSADLIGNKVTDFETLEGYDHGTFKAAHDEKFMTMLTSLLSQEDGSVANFAVLGSIVAASLYALAF